MIDHSSSTPLYLQLAEMLERQIYEGVYAPGAKLPSENALCREYSLSRITVRQALNLLTQKDMVYSAHGKGTFVKIPEVSHELTKIIRFGATLQRGGLNGYTKVHHFDAEIKDERAYAKLQCEMGGLELIGYIQGTPAVYYHSYIRKSNSVTIYSAAKQFEMQHYAFSSYDLYDAIGVMIYRVNQHIGAVNADKRLSGVFEGYNNQALIRIESLYSDQKGEPLEFKIAYYRADIYSFELQRELN